MTKDEAIKFHESGKWESMSSLELAKLQINEPRLCIPFSVFSKAVSEVVGYAVMTHEFATRREELKSIINSK